MKDKNDVMQGKVTDSMIYRQESIELDHSESGEDTCWEPKVVEI